jgi:DNA polymerase III subunit gamma/tau
VRLAYAAELPAPADLVKALAAGSGATATAQPQASSSRPGAPRSEAAAPSASGPSLAGAQSRSALAARPMAEPEEATLPMASAAAPPAPEPSPAPKGFDEVVALFETRREAVLAHALVEWAHLVRFEPGFLEFRPEAGAPDNLANRVGQLLGAWTGRRWMVTVSREPGAPTIAERRRAAELALKQDAAQNPLVRAVLDAFPGAAIEAVRDIARVPADAANPPKHGDKS